MSVRTHTEPLATEPSAVAPVGPLDERLSSPGLLLALLGHEAMRRLREAHTGHELC